MKSTVVAMGLFAVLANAYQHPRHFHFPRDNITSADAGMTTLTVIATQVSTVTSCAPTVIDCPSRETDIATLPESDRSTFVVTNTVILTETVCPVSEVPAISSSVVSEAEAGSITGTTLTAPLTSSIPLTTGSSATISEALPESPEETGNPSITVTSIATEKTYTITLGTGTDTSVVTSTIQTTIVSTVTCDGGCGGSQEESEPTTTTTATTTGTTTVTVPNPSATSDGIPGDSNGNGGNGGNSGSDEEGTCDCAATVTVTAPASTVYVTVGADSTKTGSESAPSVTGEADEEDDEEDGDEEDDEEDDECPVDSTVTSQTTITVAPTAPTAPFPTGNNSTSGAAAPTGFARLRY